MPHTQTNKHAFIRFLEDHADDRAMLAKLRRGLGREPGAVPAVLPYIAPFLGTGKEADLFLIAPLFALHPLSESEGNMGDHMRELAGERSSQAAENHFLRLLDTRRDTLEPPLRRAVSMLGERGIRVNWYQLMRDIRNWDHPEHFVQRNWARAFWRPK